MGNDDTGLEIAVVGMSGRFPGADNLDQFWENLINKRVSFTSFSDEELLKNGVTEGETKDGQYIKIKPFLNHIYDFDAELFGYTPWEAEYMDPQIKLFHECVYHVLEDAGYLTENYNGRIGLYAGASMDLNWMKSLLLDQPDWDHSILETGVVAAKDFMSQLISYKLNLTGPSISIQTACSTSLAAIHLACTGLLVGDCNMAIAGGVTIMQPNKSGYKYREGSIYSKDGQLRAYDSQASGTVFGEGAGAVALKRLEDAIADHDHIYAVIRSTACNNDGGRKVGFSAPSVKGQEEVIRTAFEMGEVNPLNIQMIEGHGTGTSVGDPIEVEALKLAFDVEQREYCSLGSVKANIGHLNAGAGIASFIKAVLSLKQEIIPPAAQFDVPNQKINMKETPFYINQEPVKMIRKGEPLQVGISSFGVGGTNVHMILQQAPPRRETRSGMEKAVLIRLSAKTETALREKQIQLFDYLKQHPDINLTDVSYTLWIGRKQYKYQKYWVAENLADLIDQLADLSWPEIIIVNQLREQLNDREEEALSVLKRIKNGANIDISIFYEGKDCYRVPLPLYPFQRKCFKPGFLKYLMHSAGDKKGGQNNTALNQYLYERPENEEDTYLAPVLESDKIICEVVSQILSIEKVGIKDDFFWLGAHSLLITKIISRLKEIFKTEIPLDQVMDRPTVQTIHEILTISWKTEETLDQIALAYREFEQMNKEHE